MNKVKIISHRYFQNISYWQQVYEWEDIIEKCLNARKHPFIMFYALRRFFKLFNLLHLNPQSPSLIFEMNPKWRWNTFYNKENIIPWIMDFYLDNEADLLEFYKNYGKHKIILISSLEVYNYLKNQNCPLNIIHMPITISDKFKVNSDIIFKKEFDILLMGRTNNVLLDYLEQYKKRHPSLDLIVVSCKKENSHFNYYDQNGNFYGNADSRDAIVSLLKKSRIGFYTMKGVTGDNIPGYQPNGFCHVTPRLFEYMVTGNHIIAQYIDNAESMYFELSKLFPNTDSYEIFERQMDSYLTKEVDMLSYSNYLDKHYTSSLTEPLKKVFEEICKR